MASAVMASCKTPSRIVLSPVASASKQPQQVSPNRFQQLKLAVLSLQRQHGGKAAAVAAGLVAASWGASPLPALAAEIEKAALFDFNLTLPAIASEFLLLMVALDKIYFTPLGKFMDERDAAIRAKLGDVKDTSSEVKQMEEQAAAVIKAARAEISAALNQMKKETTAELEGKLAEGRKRVEAELAEALANLERQKEDTIKALDSQIAALSDEIVKKVIPAP
ncbi:unnamed protein product [Spirodela intermedia]|uniref:Uncharacterized protein n=1 Tax=Spirodela intermedia TaxID=51605 RepID=A0A7I8LAJ9_SPIIN|nr:unnamed protein product [Spirodela intermedia]